jgi:hypothetical protein
LKFSHKKILTIISSLFVGTSLFAACVQSINLGSNDINGTNSIEVRNLYGNNDGNISIKTNLIMDINKTIVFSDPDIGNHSFAKLIAPTITYNDETTNWIFKLAESNISGITCTTAGCTNSSSKAMSLLVNVSFRTAGVCIPAIYVDNVFIRQGSYVSSSSAINSFSSFIKLLPGSDLTIRRSKLSSSQVCNTESDTTTYGAGNGVFINKLF